MLDIFSLGLILFWIVRRDTMCFFPLSLSLFFSVWRPLKTWVLCRGSGFLGLPGLEESKGDFQGLELQSTGLAWLRLGCLGLM